MTIEQAEKWLEQLEWRREQATMVNGCYAVPQQVLRQLYALARTGLELRIKLGEVFDGSNSESAKANYDAALRVPHHDERSKP